HVVGAEPGNPRLRADACRARTGEVAEQKNVGEDAKSGRLPPVMNRGQRLAHVGAVCAGFEPAHASDGEVRLVLGKRTQFPPCRSRPAGGVAEHRDGPLRRNFAAVLAEWIAPVLQLAVTAGLDELLELP